MSETQLPREFDGEKFYHKCHKEQPMTPLDKVIVQVKVPVCVTLTMDRDFAGWTDHEELCRYVDEVLRRESKSDVDFRGMVSMAPNIEQGVEMTYGINPHWDYLPIDECEIVSSEEGLFPHPDADQYGDGDE